MPTVNLLNTIPLQQFIDRVKTADNQQLKDITLNIRDAKNLAFTIGSVMSRLHGDLEALVHQEKNAEEVINVTVDGGGQGWK